MFFVLFNFVSRFLGLLHFSIQIINLMLKVSWHFSGAIFLTKFTRVITESNKSNQIKCIPELLQRIFSIQCGDSSKSKQNNTYI